jgi:hypothetical protein
MNSSLRASCALFFSDIFTAEMSYQSEKNMFSDRQLVRSALRGGPFDKTPDNSTTF